MNTSKFRHTPEFMRSMEYLRKEFVESALKEYPPEEILSRFRLEQILSGLKPEDRLAGLKPEELETLRTVLANAPHSSSKSSQTI